MGLPSFFGLFKLIPGNLLIAGVAVAGLYFVVNNHFNQIEKERQALIQVISEKDKTIKAQEEQIAGLIIDKDRLLISNESLSGKIDTLELSIERVIRETQLIIESDHSYNEKISQLEKIIADQVRQDRIAAIREGRKAELLLNYINANVECWIANFDKVNGQCIQGKWRPDNEQEGTN